MGLLQTRVHREKNQLKNVSVALANILGNIKALGNVQQWADLALAAINWIIYKLIVEGRKFIKRMEIKQKHGSFCPRGWSPEGLPRNTWFPYGSHCHRRVSMPVIPEAASELSELEVQAHPLGSCSQAVPDCRCQRGTMIFHQQFLSSNSIKQAQKGKPELGGPLRGAISIGANSAVGSRFHLSGR